MAALTTDDQRLLRDGFRALLDGITTDARRREALDGPSFSSETWAVIASGGWLEAGHGPSLDDGGSAFTLVLLGEEIGAHFVPVPFSLTAAVVVPLLHLAPAAALGSGVVVDGSLLATFTLPNAGTPAHPRWDGIRAVGKPGEELELRGRMERVPFAAQADWILLPVARADGSMAVAVAETTDQAVAIEQTDELDFSRPTATVEIDGLRIGRDHLLGGGVHDQAPALRRSLLRYLLCIDAESIGAAEYTIHRTVGFVKERRQFGVPVGSFQAVKHHLADAYGQMELSRALTHDVARRLDLPAPEPIADLICSRLLSSEMYSTAVERCIQCYGGAGFTWEQGLHGPYRQALFNHSHPFETTTLRAALWSEITGESAERPR